MTTVTFQGNPVEVLADLPVNGSAAPDFTLTNADLSDATLADFKGKKIVLNIFPSIDTGVCATSVRTFNKSAAALENTVVICVSKDLPFALGRFCGAEGIENVKTVSGFRDSEFGKAYGVEIKEGPLAALYARAVVVINEEGKIAYTELVSEITNEPNYEGALAAL